MPLVSPNQDALDTLIRNFLLAILPIGMEVIQGLPNRVAEPSSGDFVVFTPILKTRISTNVDDDDDALYTASIAGTVMTASAVSFGTIRVGAPVFGSGLAVGTAIASLGTGTGGVGTYNVSPSQTISSRLMASGVHLMLQPTQCTIQVDIHGPSSPDNAQMLSTMFRDPWTVEKFIELDPAINITPLYASNPKQMPFTNAEHQVEYRYVVDLIMQANVSLIVPQQFADVVTVDIISVEAQYQP